MAPPPMLPAVVRAVGDNLRASIEEHYDPRRVDHVWITMDAGGPAPVTLSINTLSRRNRDAGFDGRVRLGILRGTWEHLPPRGLHPSAGLDYSAIESENNVFFESCEQKELEEILLENTRRAKLAEAWGESYRRKNQPGIHQIHSRRTSCAVSEDFIGHDGALKFYFAEDNSTRLLLFKFCGQP